MALYSLNVLFVWVCSV